MSTSGYNSAIQCTFIDRKNKKEYTIQPKVNQISFSTDMKQMASSFDFEVQFGRGKVPAISSHDFVEFYTFIGGVKHQIGVGFVEDFVKKVSSSGATFEGNGRDFLAQLFFIPFKVNLNTTGNSFETLIKKSIEETYLLQYLSIRNRNQSIVDRGMYADPMLFKSNITQMRASVLQEYSDLAMNLIFQDRLGRITVYGRDFKNEFKTGKTLYGEGDINVVDIVERQNYSKTYSKSLLIWAGEENLSEGQLSENKTSPGWMFNDDPRAVGLFQPNYEVYSGQDLVNFVGSKSDKDRMSQLTRAKIRRSNQNLSMIVVSTESPFYQGSGDEKIAYQIGQIWRINSKLLEINKEYKLASIHYSQSADSLHLQLGFFESDTLV